MCEINIDERKSQEIYNLYEVTRIDGGRGSICYEIVTEVEEEAFLESFVDRLDEYDVKLLVKNLPRQFAFGQKYLSILRGFVAAMEDLGDRDLREWEETSLRPQMRYARAIIAETDEGDE